MPISSKSKPFLIFCLGILLLLSACKKDANTIIPDNNLVPITGVNLAKAITSFPTTFSVFYTGLNNPRGLKFGPDGNLYVAEGGIGGTHSTIGLCTQVPIPVGPVFGSTTGGRISMITPNRVRTTITDKLPTAKGNELTGGDIEGVADVEFVDNKLYALLSGGGCSHGVPSIPNGVIRVNKNGSWQMVANLSAYLQSHPVKNPEPDDFEPDGTPYSMVRVHDDLYVIEPNHGDLVKVTTWGKITRVVDVSASQGHIVPTALAWHGNFYLGNLHTFPIIQGSSKILKITPEGKIKDWATGLTTVLAVVIDDDNMYVLENTVGAPFPTPGLGQVIKIDESGKKQVVVTGLSLPTGMTMGPDGNLYISNWGFSPHAIGGGQIVKVKLRHEKDE